jgi:GTP-binding protein EngB required for normal cell division
MEKSLSHHMDILEKAIYNFLVEIARPFFVFFGKLKKKNRIKIKEVLDDYEKLLEEYRLIENKKSKLSSTDRNKVIERIRFLIAKGHIKIKS